VSVDIRECRSSGRWLPFSHRGPGSSTGHVGFVVDKAALGHVFSQYFGLPLLIVPPTAAHPYWAGTGGQTVCDVPCGPGLTPPQEAQLQSEPAATDTAEVYATACRSEGTVSWEVALYSLMPMFRTHLSPPFSRFATLDLNFSACIIGLECLRKTQSPGSRFCISVRTGYPINSATVLTLPIKLPA
jgi:hypothetical protein